jgi:hypothetical protein
VEVRETASAAVAVLVRICGEHLALKLASDFKEWAKHEIPASKVGTDLRRRTHACDLRRRTHACVQGRQGAGISTFRIHACDLRRRTHACVRIVTIQRKCTRTLSANVLGH